MNEVIIGEEKQKKLSKAVDKIKKILADNKLEIKINHVIDFIEKK